MGQTPFTTKIGGILNFILHTQDFRGNFTSPLTIQFFYKSYAISVIRGSILVYSINFH
jgi:hypothetical protein